MAVVESVALGAGRSQAISVSERLAGKAAATVGGMGEPTGASELEDLRCSAQRGRPLGSRGWVVRVAKRLSLESTLRPRGRPKAS